MDILLQQIINGLVLGSMYALIALGYTMVYGIIQLINFAHGEVLMVGALTSWSIVGWMQQSMPGLPGWAMLLISMCSGSCGLFLAMRSAGENATENAATGPPSPCSVPPPS